MMCREAQLEWVEERMTGEKVEKPVYTALEEFCWGVRRGERQPVARAVTRAGQALAVLLPGLIMLVEGLELHGRDSFPLLTPTH